jgi:predicted PolB exonuclease-like 3'-5' exonuclease
MTPVLVFDLETVPDVDGLRRLKGHDPAMPDAEVAQLAFAEREAKTGRDFMPLHLQRIIAIGCVFRDDEGLRVRSLGSSADHEARLIGDFYKIIDKYTPQLVSWNGSGFDLPVLHYRSMLHGISSLRYWDTGDDDREFRWNNYLGRYHARHTDLMDVLAAFQGRAAAPLDELAKLCGFPGKLGMDGSQVWPTFLQGGIADIRAYCETDVMNTWLLYCRFQLLRGSLSPAAYQGEIDLARSTLKAREESHWIEYLKAWPAQPVC